MKKVKSIKKMKNKTGNTRKIAVVSNIAGAGKTTVAVHLALSLFDQGHHVLLVDTTDGADADLIEDYIAVVQELKPLNLTNVLHSADTAAIQPIQKNLALIRGGGSLAKLDRRLLKDADHRSSDREVFSDTAFSRTFSYLEQWFDFIIFDTSSHWGFRNINTLSYADELVIPIDLTAPASLTLSEYLRFNLDQLYRISPSAARLSYLQPIKLDHTREQTERRLTKLKKSFRKMLDQDNSVSEKCGNAVICPPIHHSVRFGRSYEDEQENYSEAEWMAENKQIVREFRQVTEVMLGEGKRQPAQISETAVAVAAVGA